MKIAFLAALVAALCLPSPGRADSPKFTVGHCMTVSAGISALRFVGAGLNDPRQPSPEAKQYKLKSTTRWTLGLDQAALRTVIDGYQRTLQEVTAQVVSSSKDGIATDADRAKINLEMQKVLNSDCSVRLARIKKDDLNLEQNEIPPDVLSALIMIVDEE